MGHSGIKLSISNIGWQEIDDDTVYALMKKLGYIGLEIAPTRIFPDKPYEKRSDAKKWADSLKRRYGFSIPSMQSIWFGRDERLFGTEKERKVLLDHTKKAIDLAEDIGCRNLVFGCPKNRVLPEDVDASIAVPFFKELGDHAAKHDTVIGIEAEPTIYDTNYINDTMSAIALIKEVCSEGFKLNLDIGAMIQNKESLEGLVGKVGMISHVHISEPGLRLIKKRHMHERLKTILENEDYQGFVSIEMRAQASLSEIENAMIYIRRCFGR